MSSCISGGGHGDQASEDSREKFGCVDLDSETISQYEEPRYLEEESDSDDWETDDEDETCTDESSTSIVSEAHNSDSDTPATTKCIPYTPYIPLRLRVLEDYAVRHFQGKGQPSLDNVERFSRLKDLSDVPIPTILRSGKPSSDPLHGIQGIKEVLEDPRLTISQKYKSLGVEEDPCDDSDSDDERWCSCWQWLCYKFSRIHKTQWPVVIKWPTKEVS